MKNNYSLVLSIVGFVSAIILCSFFKIGITFSLFLVFISIILFIFRKFFIYDYKSRQKILLIIFYILFFAIGIFRYELKDSKTLDLNLEENIGNKIIITAVITEEPSKKENQTILIVEFRDIVSDKILPISGKAIISTDVYPEFKYGDLIKIKGKLEKPENPIQMKNQSGGTSFDYVSYLAKDDISYKIDFAKTEYISSSHGNYIKSFLFSIKNAFIGNLNKVINEPESSLLSGILIGAKNSLDKKTIDNFKFSGLSHVIALSGYNITIVADLIMKCLFFLPRAISFSGGVLGILLFIIMSGASSTAVRAGFMALIVILAQVTRRNYQAGRALIVAGLIMVMVNPKILVFDLSFQLSFLATIAIIYVSPILKNKLSVITEKFGLREIVSSSISAQILVLPLILYKMGTLSFVALPANILVLAFIPATMFFGFITGILGFIWLPVSLLFAWITWLLLAYIIKVSEFFVSLPFASVNITWFSSGIMITSYIFITVWVIKENRNEIS